MLAAKDEDHDEHDDEAQPEPNRGPELVPARSEAAASTVLWHTARLTATIGVFRPSGIESPERQLGTAALIVGGSAGLPRRPLAPWPSRVEPPHREEQWNLAELRNQIPRGYPAASLCGQGSRYLP
jgi:hypothetical protein